MRRSCALDENRSFPTIVRACVMSNLLFLRRSYAYRHAAATVFRKARALPMGSERNMARVLARGLSDLVLLRHKRRRFDCRMQQGQREKFRAMATVSLRRIVAIEFGM